tara:strand:+ start:199 stop:372 length:174 start_codon:yes stop_codon:yes gene_type:complete
MIRKLTRNNHQYKLSVPISLVRKLGLDDGSSVKFIEVKTKLGKGFVVVKDDGEVLEL